MCNDNIWKCISLQDELGINSVIFSCDHSARPVLLALRVTVSRCWLLFVRGSYHLLLLPEVGDYYQDQGVILWSFLLGESIGILVCMSGTIYDSELKLLQDIHPPCE